MHLWPSTRIRDSFKIAYLKKLEWNLHRMDSEKKSTNQQRLLSDENGNSTTTSSSQENSVINGGVVSDKSAFLFGKAALILRETLMVVSCCYCCFCCGACLGEDVD